MHVGFKTFCNEAMGCYVKLVADVVLFVPWTQESSV